MNTALVCIAKNEDYYIEEWLRYNLKLGFSKVFIYQNDWRANLPKDLGSSGRVQLMEWDSPIKGSPQLESYKKFIADFHQDFDWAAFFDVDEFLVVKNGLSLDQFLAKHQDCKSISVKWRLFGDNGLKEVKDGNYSVIDRFKKSGARACITVKSLINLKLSGNSLYVAGHKTAPVAPVEISSDEAELAHYMCKTWQEFVERRSGPDSFFYGRVDDFKTSNLAKMREFFDGKNKNDIVNNSVYDFYHSQIAE